MRVHALVTAAATLCACGSESEPAPVAPQPTTEPEADPADVELVFGPIDVETGAEINGLCASRTLHNEATLYVNKVEMVAGAGFHHSNWLFVPEGEYGEDGIWPCEDRGFNELAAQNGGVLFAQSTQATHESQEFLPGVAIPIPPGSKVIGSLHLLNATGAPLAGEIELGLFTIEAGEVETKLAGLALQYQALAIPPKSRSEFTAECGMALQHLVQLGRPLDFEIHYLLPHYHGLGTGMRVEAYGLFGEDEVIYEVESAAGHPLGAMLETPFSLRGFDGVRMSCRYDNPRDETVGWGIGDQEMCVLLAFTDSEDQWGGGVLTSDPGSPTMEGEIAHFEQPCVVIGSPAAHTE